MKSKHFLFCPIAIIIAFSACTPESEGMKVNLKTCLKVMSAYFPYTDKENFVFVNEELGKTCEAGAFSANADDGYPNVLTLECHSPLSKCYGDWSIYISAVFQEKEGSSNQSLNGMIRANVDYSPDTDQIESVAADWIVHISLGKEGALKIDWGFVCFPEELYSHFTDTIVLPVNTPEGAYARIVKNQGLTDFSVDGKTVWKRVK